MGTSGISVPFVVVSPVWLLWFRFDSLASLRCRICLSGSLGCSFVFHVWDYQNLFLCGVKRLVAVSRMSRSLWGMGASLPSTYSLGTFAVSRLVLALVKTCHLHLSQVCAAGSTLLVSCSFDRSFTCGASSLSVYTLWIVVLIGLTWNWEFPSHWHPKLIIKKNNYLLSRSCLEFWTRA